MCVQTMVRFAEIDIFLELCSESLMSWNVFLSFVCIVEMTLADIYRVSQLSAAAVCLSVCQSTSDQDLWSIISGSQVSIVRFFNVYFSFEFYATVKCLVFQTFK